MAKGFGGPSEYIKKNVYKNIFIYGLLFFGTIISLLFAYELAIGLYAKNNASEGFIFFVVFCLVLYGMVVAFKFAFNTDTFLRGGIGETDIADELDKLPDNYSYFRGVKIKGTNYDVDFVVIGPTGVFAIDAKSHNGKIEYSNGHLLKNGNKMEKNIIWQVKKEALFVHSLLLSELKFDIFVVPVIVFSSVWAELYFGFKKLNGVQVVKKPWLNKLIIERPLKSYPLDTRQLEDLLKTISNKI